ncbi:MAG: Na+/H+ antiporter NhaA [Gammaproteobacteria bacterium]|nr:Na+/H+ antiporter NhaA [Gammaproteobacteria bacterium]
MVSSNPSRLERALSSPKSAGAAMFGAMLLAFVWANSPYQSFYEMIHHAPVSIQVGALVIAKPMISWSIEGLTVFLTALAFSEPGAILTENLSIVVVGSLLSGAAGMSVLHFACRKIDSKTGDRTVTKDNQP